jgi:hypothetical protein
MLKLWIFCDVVPRSFNVLEEPAAAAFRVEEQHAQQTLANLDVR